MIISNSHISVEVSTHGAEITSLLCQGRQLVWQANPAFWKRHAPILFPIVGKVCDNTYRVDGQEFHLPQHGFARDSQFQVVHQSHSELILRLVSSPQSLEVYPYPFELEARYTLQDSQVCCCWTVRNTGADTMYYQIGAHPAFQYPDFDAADPLFGHLQLWRQGQPLGALEVTRLSPRGHATEETYRVDLHDGMLPIHRDLFAHDALVLEGAQADRVVLLDKGAQPFVEMTFDAPVLGLWSPVGAPFCCIEPWYGRTDAEGFSGDIRQRQHIQRLAPASESLFRYTILVR